LLSSLVFSFFVTSTFLDVEQKMLGSYSMRVGLEIN
jgi:hypothetical protein